MRTRESLSKTIPRGALVALVAGAFTVLSACSALGGGSSGDRGAQLEVRVNNDYGGANRVSVSLLNTEGERRSLGEVSAGERRSFDVTADPGSDVIHRLMAEPRRDETVVSPDIVIQENSIVTWHIQDNRIEVFVAREEGGD